MKFTRPILTALLGMSLAACSESDTVVALNVSYGEGLSEVDSLRVVLEQGSNSQEEVFDAPRLPLKDGGTELDTAYFHRITLSDSWDGETTIEVQARDEGNAVIISEEVTVRVTSGEAVAAFVELGIEPEPVPVPEDSGAPDAAVDDGGPLVDATPADDAAPPSDDGGQTDGSVTDGAVADGAVDGAVVDGAVADGAVVDGAVVDGAVVDGAVDAAL